jgi:DNA-binding transcriptional regulator GbsR (MarR family)
MSKIDIIEKVKVLKPTVSIRVLRNHKSVYNVCYKHFKNDDFINNTNDIKTFFESRYENIKSRKANYYILKTICLSLDKKDKAEEIDKFCKEINKTLEQEKKKMLESIDKEEPKKPVPAIEEDEWEVKFQDIKQKYLNLKSEVSKFYQDDKENYTIGQLKKLRNLLIMSIYCSCYCEEDLYTAPNPPRRNEIRLLRLHSGPVPQTYNHAYNLVVRPVKNMNYYHNILYCNYKQKAKQCYGAQSILLSEELKKVLRMYLNTHKNIIKNRMMFCQGYYDCCDIKHYTTESWSKLLKRITGYTCNEIRKAFVSKTYKKLMPRNNAIQQLAYRMGHNVKTAIEHYNKIPKNIK